jgi:hypothetical protein
MLIFFDPVEDQIGKYFTRCLSMHASVRPDLTSCNWEFQYHADEGWWQSICSEMLMGLRDTLCNIDLIQLNKVQIPSSIINFNNELNSIELNKLNFNSLMKIQIKSRSYLFLVRPCPFRFFLMFNGQITILMLFPWYLYQCESCHIRYFKFHGSCQNHNHNHDHN